MMRGMEALFHLDGDSLVPTELTRGGWSDVAQHGSPPSGILARAIESVPTAAPMQVVRFTIDLFRPVPLTPLTISTRVSRDGLRIQVVDAYLLADGLEVGRASGLKIRTKELEIPPVEQAQTIDSPDMATLHHWSGEFGDHHHLRRFHLDAIEIRTFDSSFGRLGPGLSWFRLKYPLVAGEEPSPFVRLATLADMSNGNSQNLDPREWLYVNPDITLYAHRLPEGEWVGMYSQAHQEDTGIGVADTRVFDVKGPVGRINQAQILDRHAGDF